jgi:hypothetical protein
MTFIDTSATSFGVEIPQISARYDAVGQPVEVTFKIFPGQVFAGRVEAVLQAVASRQVQPAASRSRPRTFNRRHSLFASSSTSPNFGSAGRGSICQIRHFLHAIDTHCRTCISKAFYFVF